MGRPRNLFIEKGSGHYSNAERKRREYEVSLIKSTCADLLDVTSKYFINKTAQEEYKRILKSAEKELPFLSNLFLDDLVAYANAYALYSGAVKELKKTGLKDAAGKADQLVKIMRIAVKGMTESLNHIGASKRYIKQRENKAEAADIFGDI